MKSVKDFEPHLALDGGKDGFYFYQKIVEQGKQYLKQGGWIFLKLGINKQMLYVTFKAKWIS